MAQFPIFLSELAEDDQRQIRHCIKILSMWLRRCDGRLQSYQADNYEPSNVLKTLTEVTETLVMIEEMKNELIEKHRLPCDSWVVGREYRRAFRDLLIG